MNDMVNNKYVKQVADVAMSAIKNTKADCKSLGIKFTDKELARLAYMELFLSHMGRSGVGVAMIETVKFYMKSNADDHIIIHGLIEYNTTSATEDACDYFDLANFAGYPHNDGIPEWIDDVVAEVAQELIESGDCDE